MKFFSRLLAAAALSSLALSAHADEPQTGTHFILTAGLTGGGDKVATVQYTNGNSSTLHAGGLVQIGAGVLWQFEAPVALALTANYHVDDATAKNGDATFDRIPLEAIAYYTGENHWRFGGGVRFVQSPKYKAHVDGQSDDSIEFKDTVGAVAEIGYGFNEHAWLNLRLVSENYQVNSVTSGGRTYSASGSINGSHIGINFLYQF
jgi:hypothetical protein